MVITFDTGYCVGSAKVACMTEKSKKVRFISRAFLIPTKKYGNILFDTGYAEAYRQNISFLYDWMLPVNFCSNQSVINQLSGLGISRCDISYIFISHFHVDHIAGLKSLKGIPWIYRSDSLEYLLNCSGLKKFRNGFVKGLLPPVPKGSISITQDNFKHPFKETELKSAPLFGDSQLQAVNLPGHALGQMGLCTSDTFFVADAVWSEESLYNGVAPSRIGLFLQHDRHAYLHTFEQIHEMQKTKPHLKCIPTHKMQDL